MEGGFARSDDGVRLWFTAEGNGPPLVLCHGGPGMWDYLGPLSELLEATAHVIRWEQRGCGRSDRRGPYTSARVVADLDDLCAHFGYDRWIVGGHSWGASVALHYALAHPERTAGLVYVGGVGLGRAWNRAYHEEADRRLSSVDRDRRDELSARARTSAEEREYRVLCFMPDFADPSAARALAAAEADAPFEIDAECHAQLNAESKTWDEKTLADRCRELRVPTLLIHGELDPRPAWGLDSLVDALPLSDLHVVPGAGHLPWVEAPDLVAGYISTFIARLRS
jgi:proline iminopeptidase